MANEPASTRVVTKLANIKEADVHDEAIPADSIATASISVGIYLGIKQVKFTSLPIDRPSESKKVSMFRLTVRRSRG